MRDISSLDEDSLASLTMREFGQISSESFTVLFERGIHTIAGFTLECLGKLHIALMKHEPEDWQLDLRDARIEELATTYSAETEILLLGL